MKKRLFALVAATTMLATTVVGCGASSSETSQLVISTWGFNEDILREEVYAPFEEEHGVEIILETGNNAERLTKLQSNPNSTVDIMYLADAFAQEGLADGLFEEFDYSKVPNSDYLTEKVAHTKETKEGPAYTINGIGIVYDKDAVGFEITSWDDLWNPALEGKISIPEITSTFGPMMVEMAADRAGVAITEDNGAAAFEELEELKPNVVKTYTTSSDLTNMFVNGEIEVAVAADFAYAGLADAAPELEYVIPAEGTYLAANTININANSENKELAYEFINYVLGEEQQEIGAELLGDAPVNTNVELTEEQAEGLTYGEVVDNAKVLDSKTINELLPEWIDQWNRLMNQ